MVIHREPQQESLAPVLWKAWRILPNFQFPYTDRKRTGSGHKTIP